MAPGHVEVLLLPGHVEVLLLPGHAEVLLVPPVAFSILLTQREGRGGGDLGVTCSGWVNLSKLDGVGPVDTDPPPLCPKKEEKKCHVSRVMSRVRCHVT